MRTSAEALVIGGGPAGAAAAARLAAAGREVILCERHAAARPQVCGEFVSASAAAELQDLGLAPGTMGGAEIRRTRVVAQRRSAEAGLPFRAYGLARARLDASLLELAAAHGAEVQRGAGVRRLTPAGGNAWQAVLSDGRRIASRTVLLASGKHEVRGHQRRRDRSPGWIGFKLHWRLHADQAAALGDRIELFLDPSGYAGLQRIGSGIVNLCLAVGAASFQAQGASFAAALGHLRGRIPALDERLRRATPLWAQPVSIAGVPYGYLCRPGECADNLFRVGDQFAVIPSFTGEGIAIALRTARLAAEAVLAGMPARRFAAIARRHVRRPMLVAALLAAATRHETTAALALRAGRLAMPTLARSTRLPAPI